VKLSPVNETLRNTASRLILGLDFFAYSLPIFNLKILLRTPTALTMVLAKLVFLFLWSVQFIVILKQLSGMILDSAGGYRAMSLS